MNELNTNKIIRTVIPQQVRIRKFEVNIDELQQILREYKKTSNLTNKQIAENLNQPLTLVEHWFRTDKSFAIPNEDIWFDLKQLLNIDINKFDKSIITFEIRDGVYDKSNRVYDTNGIAPTLTVVSAENERYMIYDNKENANMNELMQVGTLEGKGFESRRRVYSDEGLAPTLHGIGNGGNTEPKILISNELMQVGTLEGKHEQSNRIYSEKGICPTIMAGQRQTCTGGYVSPKVLITEKEEGEMKLENFKNFLEKYNFKIEPIKLLELFSGIGAIHQALKDLGIPVELVGIAEVDVDAIISYAGVHIENFKDLEFNYPSEMEMKDWLMSRNIGYDFLKQKSSIPRLKKDKLYKVYKASVLSNNYGDASKISLDTLPKGIDFIAGGFPCQAFSIAGHRKGFEDMRGTLCFEMARIINEVKPKYFIFENVKGLLSHDKGQTIEVILESFSQIGYEITMNLLNAKEFSIPQNRERLFCLGRRL